MFLKYLLHIHVSIHDRCTNTLITLWAKKDLLDLQGKRLRRVVVTDAVSVCRECMRICVCSFVCNVRDKKTKRWELQCIGLTVRVQAWQGAEESHRGCCGLFFSVWLSYIRSAQSQGCYVNSYSFLHFFALTETYHWLHHFRGHYSYWHQFPGDLSQP